MIKAGIVGASGFAGAELMRIITGHPEVEIAFVTANQHKGTAVSDLYPNLTGVVEKNFTIYDPSLLKSAEVVFVGLPHGASMQVVPEIAAKGVKVIDLSGDFRFSDAAVYESWYGVEHAARGMLGRAAYGLSEIYADGIKKAAFVSNPGCYATGALLALAPLIKGDMIHSNTIVIDSKSGASGAGRSPKQETLYCTIDENLSGYKVGGKHQHIPEIEMVLSDLAKEEIAVTFTPHLVPMGRGILTTAYATLSKRLTTVQVIELFSKYYEGKPFVKVLPEEKMPQTKAVAGSNYCHIGLAVDARTNRAVVLSAIDNLVKGASGQAVQNMNLMLGLPEDMGLEMIGLYP
ncbi:MAG: N-acetyl-gamma-glutamyl-phosphate reductase [Actinobacteria bacterium]|nr:N-acetyl-gamma-glutamyl-phosphate reductase [Actinomycetota bacterium]